MGWWSECIMGGDTPYNIAATVDEMITGKEFADSMHVPDKWPDTQQKIIREGFRKYGGPRKVANDIKYAWDYDRIYVDQVVALLAMSSGAEISEDFRRQVIESCDKSHLKSQEWCDEDARSKVLDDFVALIEKYDGSPTTKRQTGLF